MKKIITILLLLIYAASAVGISIKFHYCHEQLAKVSFQNFGGYKSCRCNPQDVPKDCCKDELKYQKSESHRTVQPLQIVELVSCPAEPPVFADYIMIPRIDKDNSSFVFHEVRRSRPEPIYLLIRVFRI